MRQLVAAAMLLISAVCGAADRLVLATATQGGSFSAIGQALKEAFAEVDPGLHIELLPTRGSAENLPLLTAGKVDLGMVEGTLLHEYLGAAPGGSPALSVVSSLFPSPGMFVVRADSPYFGIADLRGQRIILGAEGSGYVVLARHVLEGLGWSANRDFDAVLLRSAKEGPERVINGEAAALWGGGVGWPAFEAVARGPGGGRFLGLNEEEIARVRAKHPFLQPMTVPARSYSGMERDLRTVGSWSWLLARQDLPPDLGARFERALHRAQAGLLRRYPSARMTPVDSRQVMPDGLSFHPGVERSIKDRGLSP